MGTLKGVGRIHQQTFIDTYSKVTFARLCTEKTPNTAADLLNDRVLPFSAEHELPLNRILTDRGTEYCGAPDRHPCERYLALEDVDHTSTKVLETARFAKRHPVKLASKVLWNGSQMPRGARSELSVRSSSDLSS